MVQLVRNWLLVFAVMMIWLPDAGRAEETKSAVSLGLTKIKQELRELEEAAQREWQAAADAAKTQEDWERVDQLGKVAQKDRQRLAAQAVELANSHAGKPDAFEALQWVLEYEPISPSAPEAAAIMGQHHIPQAYEFAPALIGRHFVWTEPLLKAIASGVRAPKRKGPARLFLALHAQSKVELWDLLQHASPAALAAAENEHGKQFINLLRTSDGAALEREAIRAFEELAENHGEASFAGQTIAEHAKASIYALRNLRIGNTAPEIEGIDIEGKSLKLSDYRGKAVLLTFWATWCAPCVSDIPHERELLAKLGGKPFAILGVNIDEDADQARQVIQREGASWPCFADPREQIAQRWLARSLPTIYVLDHRQVIRAKGTNVLALSDVVSQLVVEAEKANGN